MKTLFSLAISLLLLECIAHCQCVGDVNLTSQAEVDAFPQNFGCSIIEGDLFIGIIPVYPIVQDNDTDISDLSALQSISKIAGSLTISNNDLLKNLNGLHSLTEIDGALTIDDNEELENIAHLNNLSKIDSSLNINHNHALINFEGLENITTLNHFIGLRGNTDLQSFKGFNNLKTINGGLSIAHNNQRQKDLSGFENLTSTSGGVFIEYNNLVSLNGLNNLATVGGNLLIQREEYLEDLSGLESLINIGGSLILEIAEWDFITEPAFSLQGLNNLKTIGSILNISKTGISTLEHLTSLESVSALSIAMTSLENLNGLEFINNLQHLSLYRNPHLTDLSALENLTKVEGYVSISSNESLPNLNGLENLTFIGGSFSIGQKPPAYLQRIDQPITDISALENLSFVGGDFSLTDCPFLETCCTVFNFLNNVQGEVFFKNNNQNCNSWESLFANCEGKQVNAQAFWDENNNGIWDGNEQFSIQNFKINPEVAYSYSDASGFSSAFLQNYGVYDLTCQPNSSLWTNAPGFGTEEIQYLDSTFSNLVTYYFPVVPTVSKERQTIDINSSITRCNGKTNFWLNYANTGTVITNGMVSLAPDEQTNFISADPPADSTSNGQLFWFYENFYPTHSNKIHLIYEMPGVDAIGDTIQFNAQIQTNEGNGINSKLFESELRCAYDPNDKLNFPNGYRSPNYTLFDDILEYTIRFQNTGNDTAFTVKITDQLSDFLDLSSFKLMSSSHAVKAQVNIRSKIATFKFEDIYLPDSFVNEPASHGYVKYQIKGNENLDEYTDIKNTASIYFDQNPPIITNTTNNRMVSVLPVDFTSIESLEAINPTVKVHPNPTSGHFTIESKQAFINSYKITNSLWQEILNQKTNAQQLEIDLSAFANGLYFISIKTKEGTVVKKVILD